MMMLPPAMERIGRKHFLGSLGIRQRPMESPQEILNLPQYPFDLPQYLFDLPQYLFIISDMLPGSK
jgi:hypothetical protein